jgi:hypothetical protein
MKDEELIARRRRLQAQGLILNRPAHDSGHDEKSLASERRSREEREAPVDRRVETLHILAELGRLRRRIVELENSLRIARAMN